MTAHTPIAAQEAWAGTAHTRTVIARLTPAEAEAISRLRQRSTAGQVIRTLAAEAAEVADVDLQDLLGPSRLARLCRIREAVYGAARDRGYSTTQTARVFRRDHSTIVSGLRNLDRRSQA